MADNNISFEVQGLKELEQALLEIGQAASAKALFPALMSAGLPIQKEAKKLAPKATEPYYRYKKKRNSNNTDEESGSQKIQVQPGGLRKSIARKRLKESVLGNGANIAISWRGSGFYGRFIEFGTSKYPAKPFLRPAFDAKKEEALTIFKQKLAENIEKQRQKIAQRTQSLS